MVINEEKEAKYKADFGKFIEVVGSYVERKQKAFQNKETPFFTEADRTLVDDCRAEISKILVVIDGHVNNELDPNDLAPNAFTKIKEVGASLRGCDNLDRSEKEVLQRVIADLREIEESNPRPAHRQ